MNEIIYALDDNLGNPDLFTGRKELLKDFEHWVYNIRKRISKSRALLSRRKKGKTVFMKRLYNIVWSQNDKVVPFYYEVEAYNVMLGHFAEDFLSSLSHSLSVLLLNSYSMERLAHQTSVTCFVI